MLLCDHRLSGLWLPAGGHVEPGEHPLGTVHREAAEELGVTAKPDAASGGKPFFLTMTQTVGPPALRHVDVSLWFALVGLRGPAVCVRTSANSPRVRWWTAAELRRAGLDRFEPRLLPALDALGLGC